jgi:hypothetical protein
VINDLQIRLKATNNKAKVAFFTLGGCAVIAFVAYYFMRRASVDKASLIGLLGLVLITASLTFYTKYMSSVYYYEIMHDTAGTPLFLVKQTVGKRVSTLCRIALYEISNIERVTRAERKEHKTPSDHRKYNYVPTFMPDVTYRMTVRSRYERAEIYVEITDEMSNMLRGYIEEAKVNAIEDE